MSPPDPRAALRADRNFRWLLAGAAISMLGDQFTLIALPWLVLRMTGDTVALGVVLALIAVPRALFILVGGALVDRHSPQRVLMITKYVNTVLLALLAAGVFAGVLTMPMVYALALGIGVATAFSIPAGSSMTPHAVPAGLLPTANGFLMGLRQLSMFLGPLLAGGLIAVFGDGATGHVADAKGIAIAFAFDASSFALSAWTLAHVRTREGIAAGVPTAVWQSVMQALRHVRSDAQLFTCYLYWAAIALLVMGPLQIALPVLASSRPELGASALGIIAGAHGAGMLLGMALGGARRFRVGTLGTTLIVLDVLVGLLFVPMGHIHAAWQGALLLGGVGVLGGSMQVAIFTWLQRRVPPAMMGRAMSLFMFIFMGLVPMAGAATGWVLRAVTVTQLFTACGLMLVGVALVAAVATPMRTVRDALPAPG